VLLKLVCFLGINKILGRIEEFIKTFERIFLPTKYRNTKQRPQEKRECEDSAV
jgi:hypothetical protein